MASTFWRVEFKYWKDGNGYSHTETVDNIEVFEKNAELPMTAKGYWNEQDDKDSWFGEYDAINVEIYDNSDNLVSECFVKKEI